MVEENEETLEQQESSDEQNSSDADAADMSVSDNSEESSVESPTESVESADNDVVEESENPDFRWYVLHVYSGREKKVLRTLKERIELANLEAMFGNILVPTETVMEIKDGSKRSNERKFFPGYVLIQMNLNDETWHLVRSAPNVMGFIGGTNEAPTPITAKEVSAILERVEEGVSKPKPKTLFEVGEVIRVTEGPFADFDGVVEDINYEKNRLRVSVLIFGRSTPVELEFSQVEKA